MKRIISFLIFTLILQQSFACSCNEQSLEKEISQTDFIASGKVLSYTDIAYINKLSFLNKNDGSKFMPLTLVKGTYRQYKIILSTIYKGELNSDTLIVMTDLNNCGYDFKVDETYMIFGARRNYVPLGNSEYNQFENEHIIWVNKCSRTTILNPAIEESVKTIFTTNRMGMHLDYREATFEQDKIVTHISKLMYQIYGKKRPLTIRFYIYTSGKIMLQDLNCHEILLNNIEREQLRTKIQNALLSVAATPRYIMNTPVIAIFDVDIM